MGIGKLGDNFSLPKRKFRWLASITSKDGKTHLQPTFVKMSSRPYPCENSEKSCSQSSDFVYECKFSERKIFSITVLDAQNENMTSLYQWLATVYYFGTNPQTAIKESGQGEAVVHLQLLDGCGVLMESFTMKDCYPTQNQLRRAYLH